MSDSATASVVPHSELPTHCQAKLNVGEFYVIKSNPRDSIDLSVMSVQLLHNELPEHCTLVQATGTRTYAATSATLAEVHSMNTVKRAQGGLAPSFRGATTQAINPQRPPRRNETPQSAQAESLPDNDFNDAPEPNQKPPVKTVETSEAEQQKKLEVDLAEEKRKQELLARNSGGSPNSQPSAGKPKDKKSKSGSGGSQTSLDSIELN